MYWCASHHSVRACHGIESIRHAPLRSSACRSCLPSSSRSCDIGCTRARCGRARRHEPPLHFRHFHRLTVRAAAADRRPCGAPGKERQRTASQYCRDTEVCSCAIGMLHKVTGQAWLEDADLGDWPVYDMGCILVALPQRLRHVYGINDCEQGQPRSSEEPHPSLPSRNDQCCENPLGLRTISLHLNRASSGSDPGSPFLHHLAHHPPQPHTGRPARAV